MGIINIFIGSFLFWIGIIIVIIVIICNYLANKISQKIKYDYLAQRMAEEICKRMMIIENQRKAAYKSATGSAEEQSRGDRNRASEQDESQHE